MFCVTAMVTQGVLSLEQSKLPQGRGALPPAVGRGKTSGLCFLLIFILTFLFYPHLVCGVLCPTLSGLGWAVTLGCSPWPGPCRGDRHGDTQLCLVGPGRVSLKFNFSEQPSANSEGEINQKLLMSQRDLCLPEGKLFPFVWEGEVIF